MPKLLGAVVAATVIAAPALAQRITGNVVGTVKDESGAVMPGVTVTLTGEKIVGSQTTVTNEEGFYRFIALPPGGYGLSFSLDGFATLKRQGVKVAVGATEEIAASMSMKRMVDEVTVVGEAPVIDTQTNAVSTNYDKDWVRNAPVPRFSMFDLIAVAPGVSQSSQGATTMSAFGSGTDENSFQIDGTNLTAPSTGEAWPYPNTDAIEEIEVLSLGAPAEYGNLTGAVFNVVTRQGTNEFHGDLNYYHQSDGLTGRNTTPDQECAGSVGQEDCLARGGFPFHREHFRDLSVQLSGPIIKDKLHFFASFQYQRDGKTPAGVAPEFFTDEKADRVFGKLNWQISSKHKLALGYHNDYYELPGDPSANAAPSTVEVNHGDNPTPNLMYTGVLSDKTILEARVAGFWGNDHADPIVEGEARIQPRFYDLDTGRITGGIYYWYDDRTYQATASAKISHFADDFLGSSHDFKFGVQYVNGGVHDAVSGPNDLVYTYTSTYTDYYGSETSYRAAYGYDYQPYAYGGTTTGVGVFFDDTIRVSERLTLNVGVRFDRNTARIPDREVFDDQGRPTGERLPAQDVYTWNTVAPRLGFNLKLTKDGKTSLKGHYGRYYRPIVTAEYSNSVAASYVVRAGPYDLESGSFVDPEIVGVSPGNQRVDPGYDAPHTDQFIASLERELFRDLALSLHYVHKRARNGSAWRDTTGEFEDVTVGDPATGLTNTFKLLVSDPADSVFELTNQPDIMKTDTNAFTAQVVKRMSHGWQLVTAYTYLDSTGVLPSGRLGLVDAQRATARFSDFGQNPNDFVNAAGVLLGNRPHTFRTQLVLELPAGFLVGANYMFQSGRAWARRGRVDLGFPTATEVNLEERDGSRRVPNQSILDLRLQKSFNLTEKVKFQVFGDALNLFNSDTNESVLSRTFGSETFGVPSDFVLPRRLIVGAKLTF